METKSGSFDYHSVVISSSEAIGSVRQTYCICPQSGTPAGPALLLLDEPTANLDPGAREAVVRAMSKPAPGTTQIIVTHHVEELPAHTSIALVLKEGLTIAVGPADEALNSWNLSSTFGIAMDIRKVESLDGGRWTARVLAD